MAAGRVAGETDPRRDRSPAPSAWRCSQAMAAADLADDRVHVDRGRQVVADQRHRRARLDQALGDEREVLAVARLPVAAVNEHQERRRGRGRLRAGTGRSPGAGCRRRRDRGGPASARETRRWSPRSARTRPDARAPRRADCSSHRARPGRPATGSCNPPTLRQPRPGGLPCLRCYLSKGRDPARTAARLLGIVPRRDRAHDDSSISSGRAKKQLMLPPL